jgi:hypothetical protein
LPGKAGLLHQQYCQYRTWTIPDFVIRDRKHDFRHRQVLRLVCADDGEFVSKLVKIYTSDARPGPFLSDEEIWTVLSCWKK